MCRPSLFSARAPTRFQDNIPFAGSPKGKLQALPPDIALQNFHAPSICRRFDVSQYSGDQCPASISGR